MDELKIKPRKNPVLIAAAIIIIMIAVCIVLMQNAKGESKGLLNGLLGAFVFLLICVLGGYFRSVLIFRQDGIYSVTALFARPVLYNWRSVDRILHEGHNYAIYSTQNKWIGTVDDREARLKDVIAVCKSHHVRIDETVHKK